MIKLKYNFKAIGPLHTGSDEKAGIMKTLRRQKCILVKPVSYSSYLTDDERREAIVQIAYGIWKSIDFSEIKGKRMMMIWDEFTNKLKAASRCETKYEFLEKICVSWGIKSLTNRNVLHNLKLLTDFELLDMIRNEAIYIVLAMRVLKEEIQAEKENPTGIKQASLFTETKTDKEIEKIKNIELLRIEDSIPCISGNSIRGKLRRLLMHDFCRKTGLEKLNKRVYHTLFTGGFLDQSTKNEDIDKMESFISMCPGLGLIGAAIGNMTIEGEMKVGWAYPLCAERGTGEKSYWQFLDTVFQTRLDSSKTEKEIEMLKEPEAPTQQMKYEYEVFADGTEFEHRFACTSRDSLLVSAFWYALSLFEKAPYLGGMGSVGNGEIRVDWELLGDNGVEYIEYLEKNKVDIHEFWTNANI